MRINLDCCDVNIWNEWVILSDIKNIDWWDWTDIILEMYNTVDNQKLLFDFIWEIPFQLTIRHDDVVSETFNKIETTITASEILIKLTK